MDSGGLVLCRGGFVQNAAVVLRQAEVAEALVRKRAAKIGRSALGWPDNEGRVRYAMNHDEARADRAFRILYG